MLRIGDGFIQIRKAWPDFKAMLRAKGAVIQCESDETLHTVFFLDDKLVYVCRIYREVPPDNAGVSAEDNAAYLTEFEDHYLAASNRPIDPRTDDGVRKHAIDAPRDPDKKPVFTMSPASDGMKTWLAGHEDKIPPDEGTTGRGMGDPFRVAFTADEDRGTKVRDFRFSEVVEIHDGQVTWLPAQWDYADNFSVGVYMPATSVVPNASGSGNCTVVYGALIPLPGVGDYDVDLSSAVPVPAPEGNGYWDVNLTTGAITPSATPGAAKWHLVLGPIQSWMLRRVQCSHPHGIFDIDVYKTEFFHPSWRLRWEITKNSPGEGAICAWVFGFRRNPL